MRVVGPITEVYGAPRLHAKRRVEKPNEPSGLGREARPEQRAVMLNPEVDEERKASRFGTASRVRDFNDAIPAPFIAQIIGQVLETNRYDIASAMRAFTANGQWRMANGEFASHYSAVV